MYLDVKRPCSAPMTKGCLSYVMPVDDGKMGAERIETSEEMLTVASQDSFGAKSTLDVDGKSYEMYRLDAVKGERSEEHTSELQSLMRTSYAVFCLQKTT